MTDETAVVHQRETNGQGTIARLLELAVDKNLSVEGLEKLVALHERMADRAAAQEFADALAAFQTECPPIAKTSKAHVATRNGAGYDYHYASLDEIARTVQPLLHRHGFSYGWDSRVSEDAKRMETTCTLRHRNGHREQATFALPIENPSAMNDQQKHAAALTYGRRQSLIAVLGLTTAEPDLDGADPRAPINDEQRVRLEDALEGVNMSRKRFFHLLGDGITEMAQIPAVLYPTAMNLILAKKRQQETAAPMPVPEKPA